MDIGLCQLFGLGCGSALRGAAAFAPGCWDSVLVTLATCTRRDASWWRSAIFSPLDLVWISFIFTLIASFGFLLGTVACRRRLIQFTRHVAFAEEAVAEGVQGARRVRGPALADVRARALPLRERRALGGPNGGRGHHWDGLEYASSETDSGEER